MIEANYNAIVNQPWVIAHKGYALLIDRDLMKPNAGLRSCPRRFIVKDISPRNYGAYTSWDSERRAASAMHKLAAAYGEPHLDP